MGPPFSSHSMTKMREMTATSTPHPRQLATEDAKARAQEAMKRLPLMIQKKDASLFNVLCTLSEADILLVPRGKMVSKAWTLSSTNPPIVTPPTGQSSCSKKVRIAKDGRTKFKMYGRLHTREKFELKIEFYTHGASGRQAYSLSWLPRA